MFQSHSSQRTRERPSSSGRLRQRQQTSSCRLLLHKRQLHQLERLSTTLQHHRMLSHREDDQERMSWTFWWRKAKIHTLQSDVMCVTGFSRAKSPCKLIREHIAENGRTFATSQTVEKLSSKVANWRLINGFIQAKNHLHVPYKVVRLASLMPIAIAAFIHMQASNASILTFH